MIKNPCLVCDEIGCGIKHDICPLYQEFKSQKEKIGKIREKYHKRQTTAKKGKLLPNSAIQNHIKNF